MKHRRIIPRAAAFAAAVIFSAALLLSCSGGGKSVSVGGNAVPYRSSSGEPDASVLSSLDTSASAHAGDDVTVTFECVPDTVAIACTPDGGESFPVQGTLDGLSLTFPLPDVTGICRLSIEYTVDGLVYYISFAVNVA